MSQTHTYRSLFTYLLAPLFGYLLFCGLTPSAYGETSLPIPSVAPALARTKHLAAAMGEIEQQQTHAVPGKPPSTVSPPGDTTGEEHLRFAVILSRHGVRAPTGKAETLNSYSSQPWPQWDVPPGYLTTQGRKLMTIFGRYDRAYFAQQGLVSAEGCGDAGNVSIYADSDQRTIETGKALAAGAFPGCTLAQHTLAEGAADPLFHSLDAGVGKPSYELAAAAVAGRIGSNPAALTEAYRPQLERLQAILRGCDPQTNCPANDHRVAKPLLEMPSSLVVGKGDHLAELKGPLSTAATVTENLLLEYTNGLPADQVGWGKVDSSTLKQMLDLHTASADLTRRTPYLAQVQGSNLLSHILESLEQRVVQKPVAGALTRPPDTLLILVGHDTNLTNIAGMLNLSWLADGRRDDTPPGGAIVFELWQHGEESGESYAVRTYYTTQTLEQMRNATPLTLAEPPAKAKVFIPGCSSADADFSCNWKAFQQTVQKAIDPSFVR